MKARNLIGREVVAVFGDGITGIKGKVRGETNEEAIVVEGRLVTADPVSTSPDIYWMPITGIAYLRLTEAKRVGED